MKDNKSFRLWANKQLSGGSDCSCTWKLKLLDSWLIWILSCRWIVLSTTKPSIQTNSVENIFDGIDVLVASNDMSGFYVPNLDVNSIGTVGFDMGINTFISGTSSQAIDVKDDFVKAKKIMKKDKIKKLYL